MANTRRRSTKRSMLMVGLLSLPFLALTMLADKAGLPAFIVNPLAAVSWILGIPLTLLTFYYGMRIMAALFGAGASGPTSGPGAGRDLDAMQARLERQRNSRLYL